MRGRPVQFVVLCAALLAVALLAPAASLGAYAPKLAVKINPTNAPDSPIAFDSIVTQSGDEEPTASARVHFPRGVAFSVAALGRTQACTPAQRDSNACPDGSRLGTANASTAVGNLTGGVYLGEAATIYIFLKNPTLALIGKEPGPITAKTEFRPDGGTDTVLDNLPTDITATSFELALDGPPRSVLNSPQVCGTLPFSADFVSKSGVKATSKTSVTFTGCPPVAPEITRLRLSRTRVTLGTNVALSYSLDKAAQIEITVRRSGKRKILGRTRFADGSGASRIRVITRRLTPGAYIVGVRATSDGKSASRSKVLRILAKRKKR